MATQSWYEICAHIVSWNLNIETTKLALPLSALAFMNIIIGRRSNQQMIVTGGGGGFVFCPRDDNKQQVIFDESFLHLHWPSFVLRDLNITKNMIPNLSGVTLITAVFIFPPRVSITCPQTYAG